MATHVRSDAAYSLYRGLDDLSTPARYYVQNSKYPGFIGIRFEMIRTNHGQTLCQKPMRPSPVWGMLRVNK